MAKNLLNQIQHILVINKLDVAPVYLLFSVLFLLHFKHMLQTYNYKTTKKSGLNLSLKGQAKPID